MRLKHIVFIAAALSAAAAVAAYATLKSVDVQSLRGLAESEVHKATGRTLTIAGPIELQISLRPAIALEDVSFANTPWGSGPPMAHIKRLDLEISLLPLLVGEVRIRRLVLVEPTLLLETDRNGRGNWLFDGTAAAGDTPPAGTALPTFSEMVLRDGRVHFHNGKTGRRFQARISELSARAENRESSIELAISGTAADIGFVFEGTLGSLAALAADEIYPVRFEAALDGIHLTADGHIEAPLTDQAAQLALSLRVPNLADVGAVTNVALPEIGPISLSAQVARDGRTVTATGLAMQLHGSDLAGNARVAMTGSRPSVTGKFTAALLDLADFLPPGGDTPAQGSPAAPAAAPAALVIPDTPLPFAALSEFEANLTLAADVVRLRQGLELTDVDLRITVKDRRLTTQLVTARLAGGAVTGALGLDANVTPPAVTHTFGAEAVDYGRLLADLDVSENVSGTLRASADLRAAGGSPRALAASLQGRVDVVAGEGRIDSALLDAAGTGVLDMFAHWRTGDEDPRLICAVVRLPVRDGVATGEVILLDTSAVTVGGEGRIDLRDEKLDLRLIPQAKQASLLSLAVPFRIAGTLGAPRVGPDPLGTAIGVAKVAGILINPLAVGAALLLESGTSARNPCVAALAVTDDGTAQSVPPPGTLLDRATRGVTDTLEDVGEGLKGLFGN